METKKKSIMEMQHEIITTSRAAFTAIHKLEDTLNTVKTAIQNADHITTIWWVEHENESSLYAALKKYEETMREYDHVKDCYQKARNS